MKEKVYSDIINEMKHWSCFDKGKLINGLKNKYKNVSDDTFISIFSQQIQRKVKKTFHRHHRIENIRKYYSKYKKAALMNEKPGVVFRLSKEIDYPPTLVVRLIMEEYYKEKHDTETVRKDLISYIIKNHSEIEDKYLQEEVDICIKNDEHYGPVIENIKKEIGLKYEKILHEKLIENNIHYYNEDELRQEGYDKTPDFKLVVPIAVNCHVVNWIESKALFGDTQSHSMYLEKQFWSYTNRFGPGLVIYWFGYINELDINVEQGIMLSDDFPKEYTKLDDLLDEHESNFTFHIS